MTSEQPRLERFLEHAVRTVAGTQIHPVAVLQEIQAAAEAGIRDGSMPNRYRVELSPGDLARFSRIERQLRSGVERMLDGIAVRRFASRIGPWQVNFVEGKSVLAGDIRVQSSFAEMAHRPEPGPELEPRATEVITRLTGVAIGLPDGSRVPVTHAPFSIGRAVGCDLVLSDLSVSRRHAIVRRLPGGELILQDLQSRNGVTVAGERVTEVVLRTGTHLWLGDVSLSVEIE